MCVLAALALAQTAGADLALDQSIGHTTGTLTGIVRDQTRLVLPGVTITITRPALIGERVLATDAGGAFCVNVRVWPRRV